MPTPTNEDLVLEAKHQLSVSRVNKSDLKCKQLKLH